MHTVALVLSTAALAGIVWSHPMNSPTGRQSEDVGRASPTGEVASHFVFLTAPGRIEPYSWRHRHREASITLTMLLASWSDDKSLSLRLELLDEGAATDPDQPSRSDPRRGPTPAYLVD
ncbi:MAG: hypothetical protein AAFV62_03500 [Pseudomonadota bacterium]